MTMLLERPPAAPTAPRTASTDRLTADDLERLPDGDRYELVGGELVEKPMGAMSSWVGMAVGAALCQHCQTTGQGSVFDGECGYRLFPERRDLVRKPDVSFISEERLPEEEIPGGFFALAPDLAVEVISPRESFYEVEAKVQEYREAGVRQIWVLNPELRTITVYDGESVCRLTEADTLTGGALLPGFQRRVGEFFPRRRARQPQA